MIFDVLAAVLAVIYTVRLLDARRQVLADHPGVDAASFAEWQRREVSAYRLGSTACVFKAIVGLVERFQAPAAVAAAAAAGVGWVPYVVSGTVFFAWVTAVIVTFVRGRRARIFGLNAGVRLGAPPPSREPG
ncbi:MAG: hypothetical protein IT376_07000 [Polyangiaceae bacterium]|nr:hypothetical protein [Polyangiaceae bacterium]